MQSRDVFDNLSPLDYRYYDEEVAKYLSENGFTRYKLCVEMALVTVLRNWGICPPAAFEEIKAACVKVNTQEVYKEEHRIRHDIRALVNCICAHVSDAAKPYVHMTATSFDIVDTANAARYKDVVEEVLVPRLIELMDVLINITLREAETLQVGRTHGQHAVPITFGFAMAGYVSRLGNCIEALENCSDALVGKFSGAVGAYNASSLFFSNPQAFEREVLAELNLLPAEHSTQIVPPEALTRLLCEVTMIEGILANLSDDMRHLQRSEIGEVGEEFGQSAVGSSTMPQKRNPINFENAKSFWKIVMPRLITVFMDQISEHQRDLTNSASARTYGEIFDYVVSSVKRLTLTMRKLTVDRANLQRNFAQGAGLMVAEPLYIILASLGHPDAHEKVRQLTLKAQQQGKTLQEIIFAEGEGNLLEKFKAYQIDILSNPSLYTGIAAQKARDIANSWKHRFGL